MFISLWKVTVTLLEMFQMLFGIFLPVRLAHAHMRTVLLLLVFQVWGETISGEESPPLSGHASRAKSPTTTSTEIGRAKHQQRRTVDLGGWGLAESGDPNQTYPRKRL